MWKAEVTSQMGWQCQKEERNESKEKEFDNNCDTKLKRVLKDFHRRSSIKLTLFKKEHNT